MAAVMAKLLTCRCHIMEVRTGSCWTSHFSLQIRNATSAASRQAKANGATTRASCIFMGPLVGLLAKVLVPPDASAGLK